MPIKVGDKVKVQCNSNAGFREIPGDSRVMAIAEGYAMVRFPRCMPFIESVKDLERWNPQEASNDE